MSVKYNFLLFFLTIIINGCGLPGRIQVSKVITDTKKMRDAEKQYKRKFGNGNYASIDELIKRELLEDKFADGIDGGFKFSLNAEKNHYQLYVITEQKSNDIEKGSDVEELSLYLDETSVIRASIKPNRIADAESSEINPK